MPRSHGETQQSQKQPQGSLATFPEGLRMPGQDFVAAAHSGKAAGAGKAREEAEVSAAALAGLCGAVKGWQIPRKPGQHSQGRTWWAEV